MLAMVIGLNGLFRPLQMGSLVGLTAANKVGQVEIRALFGTFLVTLPALVLIKGQVELFEFYGMAALAAAIIKSSFAIIDGCPIEAVGVGILVDIIIAVLLLSSRYL